MASGRDWAYLHFLVKDGLSAIVGPADDEWRGLSCGRHSPRESPENTPTVGQTTKAKAEEEAKAKAQKEEEEAGGRKNRGPACFP